MGTIKQATYGDDNASSDVTDALVNMYRSGKNYVELTVGPGILQRQEVGPRVELTPTEEETIQTQAQEMCGNALDVNCMRTSKESLRSSKLEEKARDQASIPIRGERLTVTLVENGREKTVVIPKNEVFRYGTAPKETTQQITSALTEYQNIFNWETLSQAAWTGLYYFIWAFGSAFAWLALGQPYQLTTGHMINPGDYWWLKYVGTIIALLSGGWGGFVVVAIVYFVLGLKHYIGQRSLLVNT
jgi:hypothetical protein